MEGREQITSVFPVDNWNCWKYHKCGRYPTPKLWLLFSIVRYPASDTQVLKMFSLLQLVVVAVDTMDVPKFILLTHCGPKSDILWSVNVNRERERESAAEVTRAGIFFKKNCSSIKKFSENLTPGCGPSWLSRRFQYERTRVRIQPTAIF